MPWGFRLDPLSGMMLLVVTGIGTLIHVYSTAYMADEPRGGVARFFCYLNLFCFFMLMLVLGNNFLVMFVGWEGVGLCSYLLIGYWYEKKSAADAGKKAFITNRIGDWGFVLGVFLDLLRPSARSTSARCRTRPRRCRSRRCISACCRSICLLLFVGATGKSAQIPLYVWLPDAMEGPTPVSALIHAATMVTAGVYMVGRNAVLFSHAPMVMTIVAIVGVLTALMAASIGLVQYDIKRVLAYSTVSQLGYMFTAMGVGAFSAGAFHLMTHAFFKALLFLGSGSVIHAMGGEQDMRRMGGLKKYMPVTFATMLIGTLAIAGIPPFAGFFSKDEILFRAFLHNKAIWVLAVATALMTAFYMFRLMAMTFFGALSRSGVGDARHGGDVASAAAHGVPHPADPHAHGQAHRARSRGDARAGGAARRPTPCAAHDDHGGGHGHGPWHGPHESPTPMTFPLMALAVGAIVAGSSAFRRRSAAATRSSISSSRASRRRTSHGATATAPARGAGARRRPSRAEHERAKPHASRGVELGLMGFSVLIARRRHLARAEVLRDEPGDLRAARRSAAPARTALLSNKYYVDELYNATVIAGTMARGRGLWTFDRNVVDGAVNGTGWVTVISVVVLGPDRSHGRRRRW